MKSRLASFLVVVCVVALPWHPAGAQDAQTSNVSLQSMSISVKVRGRLATTTMDLIFSSIREAGQGILQWRMAPDAVVHDLVLWVGDLRIPCEVCPRRSARAMYDRIVAGQRDPAIVEYLGDGVWNLSVFPVSPDVNRKVRVVYSQMLGDRENPEYVAPRITDSSPCRRARTLDFEAEIDCPGGVKDFVANREMGVARQDRTVYNRGKVVAGFRTSNSYEDARVKFFYVPVMPLPQVLSAPAEADANRRIGDSRIYIFDPNAPKALTGRASRARNVVLVLDASGSMAGEPWKTATAGAMAVLADLTEHDRFTMVICGHEPRIWEDSLRAGTAADIHNARRMIRQIEPAGGTDLAGALRAAAKFNKDGEPAEIIVISDGWDQVAARHSAAKPEPDDPKDPNCPTPPCRIFALGVAGRNEGMEALARTSGGAAAAVTDTRAADTAVNLLMKRMRATRTGCVSAQLTDSKGAAIRGEVVYARRSNGWPTSVGWIADKGDEPAGLGMSATVNGLRTQVDCNLASLTQSDPNSLTSDDQETIRRIYAHMACQTRYPQIEMPSGTADDLASLLALCRQRHIASSGSALLVLETDREYQRLGLARSPTVILEGVGLGGHELADEPPPKDPDRLKQEEQFEKDLRSKLAELLAEGKLENARELCQTTFASWDQRPELLLYLQALQEFLGIRMEQSRQSRHGRKRPNDRSDAWYDAADDEAPAQIVPTSARFAAEITPNMTPAEQEELAGLNEKAPKVEFDNRSLYLVFHDLLPRAGLDIDVSWAALKRAGIDESEARLTVEVEEGTARDTLKAVLSAVKSKEPLAFLADGGSVIVTTRAELPNVPLLRLYDLRPILCGLPCYRPWGKWDPFSDMHGRTGGDTGVFGTGIFGESTGGTGIFSDSGSRTYRDSWGDAGSSSRELTLMAQDEDLPEPGGVFEVWFDADRNEALFSPIALSEDDYYPPQREPRTLARVFPDRTEVAKTIITKILRMNSDGSDRLSSDLDTWYLAPGGTVAVRNSPAMHTRLAKVIRQLNDQMRNDKLTDAFLPHWPESMFTWQATIEQWTAGLLQKARNNTLSPFSSAKIQDLPPRRMVRIGGIWFDAALTGEMKIYTVARASPAGRAVRTALGGSGECFSLTGPVIIPAGTDMAICMDQAGIRDEKDPDLQRLLAALAAAGPTAKPARTGATTRPAAGKAGAHG